MNSINYSFIIPHKNSPVLLKRCLDSIPNRSDIEIVVVDDNSVDEVAVQIVVNSHTCARLYRNEGKFAGGARNTGLKHVKGKWIIFSDADDFFHANFLNASDKYLESDNDIVFFDVDSCYSDSLKQAPTRSKNVSPAVKNGDIETLKWGIVHVWGKMYASHIIFDNNILFDEVKASNDVMFAYKSSYHAKKCVIEKFVMYCNTVNHTSLCYQLSKENVDSRVNVRIRANRYLHSIGKDKYHGNLFRLYLYYKYWGGGIFINKLGHYLKKSNAIFIWYDMKLSFIAMITNLIKHRKSGMNEQIIIK